MTPVQVVEGSGPVVLGIPHSGTFIPDQIWAQLNDTGRALQDTDWHIDRLYAGLAPQATTVKATFHRYVIDANRDPQGVSLYPGQTTTALVPETDFDGNSIWDQAPTQVDIDQRRIAFHAPYHQALRTALARAHARHGIAILYDCHSIRSRIPYLFDGTLPDMNIGTNMGVTGAAQIEAATYVICVSAQGYTSVLNGRFKGGWTTRHYGAPQAGIHAIQMELAQSTYLRDEAHPWAFDADKAALLRPHLKNILQSLTDLAAQISAPQGDPA